MVVVRGCHGRGDVGRGGGGVRRSMLGGTARRRFERISPRAHPTARVVVGSLALAVVRVVGCCRPEKGRHEQGHPEAGGATAAMFPRH